MIDVGPARDWIAAHGLVCADPASLVEGLGERLVALGLPVWRLYIAMPTISREMRGFDIAWTRGDKLQQEAFPHDRGEQKFLDSPFGHMIRDGVERRRWRLAASDDHAVYPALQELRALGATDYIARIVEFTPDQDMILRGIVLSCATDRAGGFTDPEIEAIDALVPFIALAAYRIALAAIVEGVLHAYVGREAGRRVLKGEIRRGQGETLDGALLFADLRSFTPAAEIGGAGFVARLDEHLEAMVCPVEEAGGEVLKFLGDGLLAGFRMDDPGDGEAVLAAALEAIRRNALVNARYPDDPALDLDVALHRGPVFYGNVGGGKRLDFTVIG
ncbi:MAG: adenylate/guanylate cyclase domain-containing protein, partial [Methylobacteriaceae bacterium]|nr:adenylate/guanylate cyclase domain-containing protein [Methylobacteriaceae bacterium]